MTTGLKQMVEDVLGTSTPATPETSQPVEPVDVSSEALHALSQKMREWSGWPDAKLLLGRPTASPYAQCVHETRTFTANPETLILNPNRVLQTVTPFRLRQEAVLTGCLLHEAGHARHSLWMPSRGSVTDATFLHDDGTRPTVQTVALARLMEEPRVEGLQARDADRIGATGLGWTMRAASAHLLPMTVLAAEPNQKIMDLITSWALRAGRQIALAHHVNHTLRNWVQDFTSLLHAQIEAHLMSLDTDSNSDPAGDTKMIMDLLLGMIRCEDDRSSTMIDWARKVLVLLFPETDPEDQPSPSGGCGESQPDDQPEDQPEDSEPEEGDAEPSESEGDSEGDEAGSEGEGDTESEDEGEGEDPGEGDTGDDGDEDGASTEPDAGEPDDQPGESETDTADTDSELANALADLEADAKDATEEETEEEASGSLATADGAGTGGEGDMGEGWRAPTKEEREIQKGAEKFLRGLIEPSESSKVTLTDTPASTVDGAALSAWKAGGQVNAPHFFQRTRRTVEPSPPIKVAILVDISGSMEELQKPSSVLSWALASAALDLRNFAGRGQQIESCLIHWGSEDPTVIQRNGQMLPGIREVGCWQGTSKMHAALDMVEEELPGFFDVTDQPVHRLLVQFTDWELSNRYEASKRVHKALAAGVNMVTIAPHDYSERRSDLNEFIRNATVMRGTSTVLRYNKMFPEQVWENAAEGLR